MSKFRGLIGIARNDVETSPGIFVNTIEEITVNGDMYPISARWRNMDMNNSLSANHVLSMVAPENSSIQFNEAVYVVWQGQKWSVTSIRYTWPRVELSLGGRYNG